MSVKRRNLDPGQRAVIALEFLPELEKEAGARRKATEGRPKTGGARATSKPPPKAKAREEAATKTGASPRGVQAAKRRHTTP